MRNSLRGALASIGLYALYPFALSVVIGLYLRDGEFPVREVEIFLKGPAREEGSALLTFFNTSNREVLVLCSFY